MIAPMNLLLQTTQPAGPGGSPAGPGSLIASPFFLIMLMLVVFWVVMYRGNRREKQKKQELLNSVRSEERV